MCIQTYLADELEEVHILLIYNGCFICRLSCFKHRFPSSAGTLVPLRSWEGGLAQVTTWKSNWRTRGKAMLSTLKFCASSPTQLGKKGRYLAGCTPAWTHAGIFCCSYWPHSVIYPRAPKPTSTPKPWCWVTLWWVHFFFSFSGFILCSATRYQWKMHYLCPSLSPS